MAVDEPERNTALLSISRARKASLKALPQSPGVDEVIDVDATIQQLNQKTHRTGRLGIAKEILYGIALFLFQIVTFGFFGSTAKLQAFQDAKAARNVLEKQLRENLGRVAEPLEMKAGVLSAAHNPALTVRPAVTGVPEAISVPLVTPQASSKPLL